MSERTPAAAEPGWRRPATLAELRAALDAFPDADPLERARRAPELIEAAKSVLADERSRALAEAKQTVGATALARELGISRGKVYQAITRTTGSQAP